MPARNRQLREIQANLTPMIDMTFLLIVFFVLVSQITEVENVEMDLPAPRDPASVPPDDQARVVINVLPGPQGRARGYRLGSAVYSADAKGLEGLTSALAGLYQGNPALGVNLRADRGVQYSWIEPVFDAVAAAARKSGRPDVRGRMNLVVVKEASPARTRASSNDK